MNVGIKGNEKSDINSDRSKKLGQFNSLMIKISSESENLIKTNDYERIQFYRIIISYLNYYNYNTFELCINKLYNEKCEILLVYFTYF